MKPYKLSGAYSLINTKKKEAKVIPFGGDDAMATDLAKDLSSTGLAVEQIITPQVATRSIQGWGEGQWKKLREQAKKTGKMRLTIVGLPSKTNHHH